MDEVAVTGPGRRGAHCRFGPDRRLIAGTAVLAVLALIATLLASDGAGRLLFAGATLVLAGYVFVDLACWPRLAADPSGLDVRVPFAHHRLRWDEIDSIVADVRHRHGLRTCALEIDAGDRLLVFSRRALGADPEEAAALLRGFAAR